MAEYPREIYLDEDTEKRLREYIEEELTNHYAERGPHVDDLMRWQSDYWAQPSTKELTFPFVGAANLVIPLSAIAVEAIHARTMTTMFALDQFVSAKAISPQWAHADKPLEQFMDDELRRRMKVRKPFGDCFLEATKFGSMIGKVSYVKLTKRVVRSIGEEEQEFDVIVKDGAVFDAVPDSRFLMPHAYQDPQTAPWCGEEHTASVYDVMMNELSGFFRPQTIIDQEGADTDVNKQSKLRQWVTRNADSVHSSPGGVDFDKNQQKLENTEEHWPKELNYHEIWLAFDTDKSNIPKEICVFYHRESQTFMSIRYNWHYDGRRPYRTGVYFPVEHRWRGIGVCKKNEHFQREVTIQHRQRIDNATLANMRMIKISRLSDYGPGEPIFPGKMWFVDDVTQIDTMQMGEIYPSAYNNEQATVIYSQQRTGANEVMLGMPQVGTPGTATSDIARIQEGAKKFDFIYANFREFGDEIITDIACTIQQFGPRSLSYLEHVENGDAVAQLFQMPEHMIKEGVLIHLRTVSQQQNKILDRQNWVQQAALLQQYFQGLLQLALPLGNPQLMSVIFLKGMSAANEAMRQILESFDTRNIDRLVVGEIEEVIQNGLGELGVRGGGSQGASGAGPASPMDYFNQIIQNAGGNGNGAANRIQGPV